jgi:hypothetical protein
VINHCLAGFVAAIRITCLLDMGMLRNTFVSSLSRLTGLHSPTSMEVKNAKAFRALLFVADDNANHLHVSARKEEVQARSGLRCLCQRRREGVAWAKGNSLLSKCALAEWHLMKYSSGRAFKQAIAQEAFARVSLKESPMGR